MFYLNAGVHLEKEEVVCVCIDDELNGSGALLGRESFYGFGLAVLLNLCSIVMAVAGASGSSGDDMRVGPELRSLVDRLRSQDWDEAGLLASLVAQSPLWQDHNRRIVQSMATWRRWSLVALLAAVSTYLATIAYILGGSILD